MAKSKSGSLLENVKTIVYAGLIAVGIRTVAFEPFNIPSGSMIPTLLVGDYLFVSKYSYGYSRYSLPFAPNLFSGRIFGRLPERGDVAVFKFPRDNQTDYIKRIVGLPGDRMQVRQGQLYINGTLAPRQPGGEFLAEDNGSRVLAKLYRETLPNGRVHDLLKMTDEGEMNNTPEYKVPEGHVFAMGDNRDNSADSRVMNGYGVGFVPVQNLVGRAEFHLLLDRRARPLVGGVGVAVRDPLDPAAARDRVTDAAAQLRTAETILGHDFARPELLAEALTHRSAAQGQPHPAAWRAPGRRVERAAGVHRRPRAGPGHRGMADRALPAGTGG